MKKDEMKMVRDPLYGDIFVSCNDVRLIDTEEIQRLKGISQLGTLQWVYPGATHSRFEHSIGVLHLGTSIAKQLLPPDKYEEIRDLLSAACLFHDSGHAPLSHTFEEYEIPLKTHEGRSAEIARTTIESMKGIEISGEEVSDILIGKKDYLSDIISGTLDADRLDYLRRDALHTGVTYGVIDTRIFSLFKLWNGALAIDERATVPCETVLFSRYVMRAVVYDHKVSRAIGGMLAKALEYAMKNDPANKNPISEGELMKLNDYSLLWRMKQCNGVPRRIVESLERRDILKLAGQSRWKQLMDNKSVQKATDMTKDKRLALEGKLADELGLESFEVIVDKPKLDKYIIEEGKIPVVTDGKSCKTLLDVSNLAKQINEAHKFLWAIRLYVPERCVNDARAKFEKITGIKLYPPLKSPIKKTSMNW